jgi:hypothetical protein
MADSRTGEFVGRNLFFKNFDLAAPISQDALDALVSAVQVTSTVTAIGEFTAGVSTEVNMIIEGPNVTAVTGGFTVSDFAF